MLTKGKTSVVENAAFYAAAGAGAVVGSIEKGIRNIGTAVRIGFLYGRYNELKEEKRS